MGTVSPIVHSFFPCGIIASLFQRYSPYVLSHLVSLVTYLHTGEPTVLYQQLHSLIITITPRVICTPSIRLNDYSSKTNHNDEHQPYQARRGRQPQLHPPCAPRVTRHASLSLNTMHSRPALPT